MTISTVDSANNNDPQSRAPGSSDFKSNSAKNNDSQQIDPSLAAELDSAVDTLYQHRDNWIQTSVEERVQILQEIKDELAPVAEDWANEAAQQKKIGDSHLAGEEWVSGPYAVMAACNHLMHTLSEMEGKAYLKGFPIRRTTSGQQAVKVTPHSFWDHLLLSGIKAEVWMKPGVSAADISSQAAPVYNTPASEQLGKVALVLGAGNIAAIAPLDCFQKLFAENQVVILKMNPVNDYLAKHLEKCLKPLIKRGVLRIVKGGVNVGAYLCTHDKIDDIHITGAAASHDIIVWGQGQQAIENKQQGTPVNTKHVTSELGNVSPTIVVPGPWSSADLKFQAEHIATQKMHNAGHNCVALQVLIMPEGWSKSEALMKCVDTALQSYGTRETYYPKSTEKLDAFCNQLSTPRSADTSQPCEVVEMNGEWFEQNEVFAPAMSVHNIDEQDPAAYLRQAIDYANTNLYGTLGANILIHPKTISAIGEKEFEAIIAELRYGGIAINAWSGLSFLMPICPWGAFPGHTLEDVQSGIGVVHNTLLLEGIERCVVTAPFKPFPRNLLSFGTSLLGKPPWFISNKRSRILGELLTDFQYKPSLLKLPRLFYHALLG